MNAPAEINKLKRYNVTISKLIKLILNLNEAHQKALLEKGEKLQTIVNRTPRKLCRIPTKYQTFDRLYSDNIVNISRSGVFIETQRPIFVGEEVLLKFTIKGFNESFKIKGKVTRASRKGIGIEFKEVDSNLLNLKTFL
jgi:Tfp pilus assembly protein PilZ